MAQRTYNEKQSKIKRSHDDLEWFDGATHIWEARIKPVAEGGDTGLCAEAKRLWEEAGMGMHWPPKCTKGTKARAQKHIRHAAEIISLTRLITTANETSDKDGDTPYMELYDDTTWRLTNGRKTEIGQGWEHS
jgi:hypothetical protein